MAQLGMSWRNLGHHDESNDAIWGIGAILGIMAQLGCHGAILGIMANRMTQFGSLAQFETSWRNGAIGMSWRNLGHHDESNDAIWGTMAQFETSWRNWVIGAIWDIMA